MKKAAGAFMKKDAIRAIAICVFRNGNRILAGEGFDSIKQQAFYRPLGGMIEFGERSDQTIQRELMEEIKAEVTGLRYLGVLENIFIYEAEKGHEIVIVYDGQFVDRSLYEKTTIHGDEFGAPFRAVWVELNTIGPGKPPLYPNGLAELLLHHDEKSPA
jgi:ADP-ribose pyrophosphatase YjhB (NUDIX family)